MLKKPLVSVAMISYNHRPYIAQAIESVLAQRRDFPIEIVISDDCSTDGTRAIIDAYEADYPGLIRRVDPNRNIGMHANLARVWAACTGKYISMLEGDDYWHSLDKLRIQVHFMEHHPECTISGHRVRTVKMEGQEEFEVESTSKSHPAVSDIRRLIHSSYLQTLSVMCRRGVVERSPDWTHCLKLGDWPLFLMHALEGKIGFIDKVLGTYRRHDGGVWSSKQKSLHIQWNCEAASIMRTHFPRELRGYFDQVLADLYFDLFWLHRSGRRYLTSRRYLWQYSVYGIRSGCIPMRVLCRIPLWFLFPSMRRRGLIRCAKPFVIAKPLPGRGNELLT